MDRILDEKVTNYIFGLGTIYKDGALVTAPFRQETENGWYSCGSMSVPHYSSNLKDAFLVINRLKQQNWRANLMDVSSPDSFGVTIECWSVGFISTVRTNVSVFGYDFQEKTHFGALPLEICKVALYLTEKYGNVTFLRKKQ